MAENKKVEVLIDGRNFTIVGNEPGDYIRSIASYVDDKIKDMTEKNNRLSASMAATLAAINITDELFKARKELSNLKLESKAPMEQYNELSEALEDAKRTIAHLKEESNKYKAKVLDLKNSKEALEKKMNEEAKLIELKEEELKDNEDIIKRLQDKVFDSQIELIETKKELDESLKSFKEDKAYSREEV